MQIWQPCASQTSQGSDVLTSEECSTAESESVVQTGAAQIDCQIVGNVCRLSHDEKGTWQVQAAFENASCDADRIALASEIRTHVWDFVRCPHGNHALQKCINNLTPHECQFIIDELRMAGVGKVARHRYGCRVLQRLLEHCPQEQLYPLVVDLLQDAYALSTHIYGHYVVQHLLEHGSAVHIQCICQMLIYNLPWVASSMYGVEVIGSALCHAGPEEQASLVSSLLSSPGLMARMASSRHGRVAAEKALKLATETERQVALAALATQDANLRLSRYGRVFAKLLEKCRRGEEIS